LYYHNKLSISLRRRYPRSFNRVAPTSQEEILALLRSGSKLTIVGAGRSMGGQTFLGGSGHSPGSIQVDLQNFKDIISFDKKVVTVQAGCTWKDLLKFLNPKGYSVRAMQSYSDFTVGGSISVNCHGEDLRHNPVYFSIRNLQIMLPNGEIIRLSRRNPLFAYVVGGYGLFGIILEVTLFVTPNVQMRKHVQTKSISDYLQYLPYQIDSSWYRDINGSILHSARLDLNTFDKCIVVEYIPCSPKENECDIFTKLDLIDESGHRDGTDLGLLANYPILKTIRSSIEMLSQSKDELTTRNQILYANTSTLNSLVYPTSNFILQEYFIPFPHFSSFLQQFQNIIMDENMSINLVNATIRYVRSHSTILSYAPQDSLALVLYIDLNKFEPLEKCVQWTQKLIDFALKYNGTYYLPYHLYAGPDQFKRSFPRWKEFIDMKRHIDPNETFVSHLWEFLKSI